MNPFAHWKPEDVARHNQQVTTRTKPRQAVSGAKGGGSSTVPAEVATLASDSANNHGASIPLKLPDIAPRLNKTEAAFLSYLRQERKYVFIYVQEVTLKLANDCRYTPDFATMDANFYFTFWEVKGFWRDDARVKIKVAAAKYPWARFIAVQRKNGRWVEEAIRP